MLLQLLARKVEMLFLKHIFNSSPTNKLAHPGSFNHQIHPPLLRRTGTRDDAIAARSQLIRHFVIVKHACAQ